MVLFTKHSIITRASQNGSAARDRVVTLVGQMRGTVRRYLILSLYTSEGIMAADEGVI
jgi:hypothetical protein